MAYEMKCHPGDHPRIDVKQEFIERNRLTLGRTATEILQRIKDKPDFLGFSIEVLIGYLTFDEAGSLLNEDATGEDWKLITDVNEAVQDFLDYMVFGWMKAMDERGISASRTVAKIGAWLWLFGREDLADIVADDSLYNPYGTPALIAVCEAMGIAVPSGLREFAKEKCTW